MNYKQYKLLYKLNDKILLNHKNSISYISNNWLHFIRLNTVYIKSYSQPLNNLSTIIVIYFSKIFKYLINSFFKIVHSVWRNYIKKEILNIENKYDYIFISHLLNEDVINNNQDFYFYNFPEKIESEGKKSLIVYINYVGKINTKFNINPSRTKKVILPIYLGLFSEIGLRFELFLNAFKILFFNSNSLKTKLVASFEYLSPASHFNLRLGKRIEGIIKKTEAKMIFTTFEGHAWERVVYASSRKINPNIKCVGYQQAIIFNSQHSVIRSLGDFFDPDFILCSGQYSFRKIKNANLVDENKLLLFGSNRTTGFVNEIQKKNKTILFLPEGDLKEVLLLIDLAYDLAIKNSDYKFILRFHPLTNVKKLINKRSYLNSLPSNIELSKDSLEEDFNKSFFAIYRGSTSIIKAIEFGLVPIFYNSSNERYNDVLEDIKFRYELSDNIEFLKITSISEEILKENLISLRSDIKNFFSPLDYTIINKLK
jgi:hypothetical protein